MYSEHNQVIAIGSVKAREATRTLPGNKSGMAFNTVLLALLTVLVAVTYGPVSHYLTVVGAWRHPSRMVFATDSDLVKIKDTIVCEDLHLYHPTNTLFTACEDDPHRRFGWFPPLGNFERPPQTTEDGGSIHIIDPEVRVRREDRQN